MASPGLDGAGLIDLARGERAEFTVSLVRQRMPVAGSPGATGADTDGVGVGAPRPASPSQRAHRGGPGLFGGFLVPEGARASSGWAA